LRAASEVTTAMGSSGHCRSCWLDTPGSTDNTLIARDLSKVKQTYVESFEFLGGK
jgi:hypothetical protein